MGCWSKTTYPAYICLFLCAGMLAGCIVHSAHPFYTADSVVDMPELYGPWKLEQSIFREGTETPWTFSKDAIVIPQDRESVARLSARFFKVHDILFLDTTADEPQQDMSLWWMFHITPLHTVSRVIAEDKTLRIIPLNVSWLDDAVRNKSVALRSVWREEMKENLFIASSAEWVDFLKKYGADPQAFPDKDAFVFVRPQEK